MLYSGQVASQLRGIEEHILEYIQACLAKFGLVVWCPDLNQTPYALYNSACRIIALDTFRQALVSHAYAHLAPNLKYAKDMILLVKLYDHFVHHYLYSRYKKESRIPGSVLAADTASPQYRRRKRVCIHYFHVLVYKLIALPQIAEARLLFLVRNNYPQRYRDLIDTKATSDDEVDPSGLQSNGQPVHLIKKRRERSTEFERWIRILDEKREEDARLDPSKRWKERARVVPSEPQFSNFVALPEGQPIDYYAPDFYNGLQPRLRAQITNTNVALLPDVNRSFLRDEDELLDDQQFNTKYGAAVLARYRVVKEAELEDVGEEAAWLADDDEDQEMSDEEDYVDIAGSDISAKQTALATQLSMDIHDDGSHY